MPVPRIVLSLAGAAALGAVLIAPVPAAAQGRPDCATVLRNMHSATGKNRAAGPDPVKVASRLGVTPDWVERCAASYGRRVKQHELKPREDREGITIPEDQEYEEVSREEKETAGDKYFTVIEDDEQNRKRLQHFDADSSAEWEPYLTHEWEPNLGHQWEPFLHDDDHPMEFEP